MTDSRPPALRELLCSCVECGLCLPHCATWLATGNEVHSPRGRLVLLGDVLRDPAATAPAAYLDAFDQCIGCRACEAVCPSGVPFSLLEWGQQLVTAQSTPATGPAWLGPILSRLDHPSLLRGLAGLAGWSRRLLTVVAGRHWRSRLDQAPLGGGQLVRLLGSLPTGPGSDQRLLTRLNNLTGLQVGPPTGHVAAGPGGTEVVFFRGCANVGLLPHTSRRLRDLLHRSGCRVREAAGQECCGALAAHTGRPGRASRLHRGNCQAMVALDMVSAPIIVEAAGCGLELKTYPAEVASRVVDASVFLIGLDLPPLGRVALKVVLHDPCHARHGQGIVAEPRDLLRRIPGLELLEPREAEVCCGSGGTWGLRYPQLSGQLGARKAADLAATGAQLAVTTNPGCLGQIRDGLALNRDDLPLIPLTDLLWYAMAAAQTGSSS